MENKKKEKPGEKIISLKDLDVDSRRVIERAIRDNVFDEIKKEIAYIEGFISNSEKIFKDVQEQVQDYEEKVEELYILDPAAALAFLKVKVNFLHLRHQTYQQNNQNIGSCSWRIRRVFSK